MLAGLFNQAGYYYGDNLYPPRNANPKGFFEDEVINHLNEDIIFSSIVNMDINEDGLSYIRKCYEGQMWLFRAPVNWSFIANNNEQEKIRELVNNEPFCYKDPRFCYTLENWLDYAQNSVVLCVYRDPASTVSSILKECRTEPYLYPVNIGVASAYKIWSLMYLRMLDAYEKHDNVYFINYDDVISGSVIPNIEQITGAKIDRSFPENRLSRSKPVFEADINAEEIYNVLQGITAGGVNPQDKSCHIDAIRDLRSKNGITEEFSLSMSTSKRELNAFLELVSTDVFIELEKEKHRLEKEKHRLNELLDTKENEINRRKIENLEYQKIIDSYELSISWRITYPLRWLKNRILRYHK
jgi:hypothetical protein